MRKLSGVLLFLPLLAHAAGSQHDWAPYFLEGAPAGASVKLLTPAPVCPKPVVAGRQGPPQRPVLKIDCGGRISYLRAAVTWPVDVWQARHAMPAGHLLQADDVQRTRIPASEAPPDALVDAPAGESLRVGVAAGQLLRQGLTRKTQVVQAGAPVVMVWESAGLRLSMPGTAMGSAALGDWVNVKNTKTGRVLRGQVLSADTLRMGGE